MTDGAHSRRVGSECSWPAALAADFRRVQGGRAPLRREQLRRSRLLERLAADQILEYYGLPALGQRHPLQGRRAPHHRRGPGRCSVHKKPGRYAIGWLVRANFVAL